MSISVTPRPKPFQKLISIQNDPAEILSGTWNHDYAVSVEYPYDALLYTCDIVGSLYKMIIIQNFEIAFIKF